MPSTDPNIRKRVRRWYQVVQARRLRDAGYTQPDVAERLGIGERTVQRWEADGELWAAAAVAPDREAVGPSKRAPWRPLEVLADAVDAAERATASQPAPPQKHHPSGESVPDVTRAAGIERDNNTEHGDTEHDGAATGGDGRHGGTAHDAATRGDQAAGNGDGGAAGRGELATGSDDTATADGDPRPPGATIPATRHGDTPRTRHGGDGDRDGRHDSRHPDAITAQGTNTPGSQVARAGDGQRAARYAGLGDTPTGRAYDVHRRDPDPLDTLPELDLLRAAAEQYVRHCEGLPPCGECGAGFPPDPNTLGALADKISKAAERVLKIRQADAIPRGQFLQFMHDLGRSIRKHCTEEQAAAISEDVLSFRPQ